MARPDPEHASEEAPAPTPIRLTYLGKDILLVPGRYLVGRSASCHVVLDDPLVSRRHARIEVGSERATIEDLGSINGVFVNAARIVDGPHVLADGDRIDIGNSQLDFHVGGVGHEHGASGTHGLSLDTLSGADPVVPADEEASTPQPEASTRQVNGILMMATIAERSLESGRIREAEEMLQSHLAGVMDQTRLQRDVDPATLDSAVNAALSLAVATGKGRWFDYSVELLLRSDHECGDALLARLERAAASIEQIDTEQLRRYALKVRGTSPGFEQLRAAQRLDTMARR